MKRTITIFLICALLLACVPTPEEDFVVQKDQQKMLETAMQTDAAPDDAPDAVVDLYERLGAPKQFQTSLSGTEGRLRVEVDARVILPEAELPIARVEARRFTREDVLALADALFGPEAEYVEPVTVELSEEETLYLWSKGYYARLIERAQWAVEHWNEGGSILYDIDDSTPADVQKKIDRLLVEQSYAPVKLPRVDRQNVNPDRITATVDDITYFDLFIIKNPWDDSVSQVEYRRDSMHNPNVPRKQRKANDIPQRDAEAAADALLEKLSLEGFTLGCAYPDVYDDDFNRQIPCWRLLYTRSVCGVAETLTNATASTMGDYNHRRDFEILQITVDADGVAGLRYLAPQTVTGIVTERTTLLPFREIEKVFRRMILVYHNNLNDGTRDKTYYTYHITTVQLGLVNIAEENAETGLLVPAWTFLGYEHIESPYENDDFGTNGLQPFLTINAIDGSLIDREGGM